MSNISHVKIPHAGPVGAELLIVGEFPSEDDTIQRSIFVGRTGEYLNHLLNLVGINRDSVRLANV